MRIALYAAAAALGAALALLGSRPSWILAAVALLVFPLAASAALRSRRGAPRGALAPLLATALSGGLLTALAVRLAVAADDWFNAGAVDCGGASASTQDSVLALATTLFAATAIAMAYTLVSVLRHSGAPDGDAGRPSSLSVYPIAVAVSGLALVGSGFVTTC